MPAPHSQQGADRQMSYVIFASPKSGTTWLQRLLSGHPETVCCESRPFGDYLGNNAAGALHVTVQKFAQILSGYLAPSIPGLDTHAREFYDNLSFSWLDAVGAAVKQQTGKPVYGEKCTPYRGTAAQATQAFRSYHPQIRFVHLVRDGRDVLVSGAAQWMNQRCHNGTPAERAQAERQLAERTLRPDDFEMFLDYWTDAAAAGLAARAMFPHYLQVKYEDFLTDPVTRATELFRFIGLDAQPAGVQVCVEATSFRTLSGGRSAGQEDSRSFFRRGVAGDWRNWFRDQHRARFNERAGGLLTQLGYSLE